MNKHRQHEKYSAVLADWLIDEGYTHCFMVAGGGCMHLINGFRQKFTCIPVVHEMSAGVAAEHFNETSKSGKAFALVTTGPGLTNVVTAIAGCFVEHRELLVIAGQVKSSDLRIEPIRQRGVQEIDGERLLQSVTVDSYCMKSPLPQSKFLELVRKSQRPHPGPVLIEVCLDVQGSLVDRSLLESDTCDISITDEIEEERDSFITSVVEAVKESARPVFLLGGVLSRDAAWSQVNKIEELGIPVLTTNSAVDRLHNESSVYRGRVGSWGGQRSANLILAQSDVVIAVGAQLDLQQTGFDTDNFAPNAKIYQIFPCTGELTLKESPKIALGLNAHPDDPWTLLLSNLQWKDDDEWSDYTEQIRNLAPHIEPANTAQDSFVQSFTFMNNLSKATSKNDLLAVASSGGTFTAGCQVYEIKREQYASTSAAFASMGYGLATAIGMSFANPGRTVVLMEGDGGFCQNLQELALVRRYNLPIKIFISSNGGYASIRATQRKFFDGAYVGCDEETGLGFPDWIPLFNAFGIPCRKISPNEIGIPDLQACLANSDGPEAFIVPVDPDQTNWPAVSSKLGENGKMQSRPIYDLLPPLDPGVYQLVTRYI